MSIWTGNKGSSGGDIPDPVPGGSHPAILVAMIDLGTQEIRFQNQDPEWARKVYFCWECHIMDDNGKLVKTQMIGRDYRLSFHPKAALMVLLQGRRGKEYAEGEVVDLQKWLGTDGALMVEETGNAERTYSSVKGWSKLMAGVPKPVATVKPVRWEIGCKDALPDWLPYNYGKSIQTIINQSQEVAGAGQKPQGGNGKTAQQMNKEAGEHFAGKQEEEPIAY